METMSDEGCWRAVLARDARCDGSFVYAVLSTGVYCRPSCPARRPRRDRVVFFPRPEGAERAGFRACLRCRPREGAAPSPQVELIGRVCRWIEEQDDGPPTLGALGERAGVSPLHLQKTFKRIVGVTPRQYAESCRLRRLKGELRAGSSVARATYGAGYGSSSRLYERSSERLGMTPATYRRGGQGMTIRYAIVACPLGRLLVAATPKGLCAVSLGDSDAGLEASLRAEYPRAEIARDESDLRTWVDAVLACLEGRGARQDLPVDIQATAFRWRVYEALRAIPAGRTRSYGEIAAALGLPRGARAVARCCATNPVALVIPCHRVVREDGGLGGYRWGLDRKASLLERERAGAPEAGPEPEA